MSSYVICKNCLRSCGFKRDSSGEPICGYFDDGWCEDGSMFLLKNENQKVHCQGCHWNGGLLGVNQYRCEQPDPRKKCIDGTLFTTDPKADEEAFCKPENVFPDTRTQIGAESVPALLQVIRETRTGLRSVLTDRDTRLRDSENSCKLKEAELSLIQKTRNTLQKAMETIKSERDIAIADRSKNLRDFRALVAELASVRNELSSQINVAKVLTAERDESREDRQAVRNELAQQIDISGVLRKDLKEARDNHIKAISERTKSENSEEETARQIEALESKLSIKETIIRAQDEALCRLKGESWKAPKDGNPSAQVAYAVWVKDRAIAAAKRIGAKYKDLKEFRKILNEKLGNAADQVEGLTEKTRVIIERLQSEKNNIAAELGKVQAELNHGKTKGYCPFCKVVLTHETSAEHWKTCPNHPAGLVISAQDKRIRELVMELGKKNLDKESNKRTLEVLENEVKQRITMSLWDMSNRNIPSVVANLLKSNDRLQKERESLRADISCIRSQVQFECPPKIWNDQHQSIPLVVRWLLARQQIVATANIDGTDRFWSGPRECKPDGWIEMESPEPITSGPITTNHIHAGTITMAKIGGGN